MKSENYFLPEGYITNPAVSFDEDDMLYWDKARVKNSLAYQSAAYGWALSITHKEGIKSIADVGCGTAAKLFQLSQCKSVQEVWGLDQPNAVNFCNAHHDFGTWHPIHLENSDSLPSRTFDLIISSDVIEHLDDPDKLLNAISLLAHKETLVLISTPERIRLRGSKCKKPPNLFHVREWSRKEFSDYLESRGAQIIEHRLLPAFDAFHSFKLFSRAIRRIISFKSMNYNQVVLMRFPAREIYF